MVAKEVGCGLRLLRKMHVFLAAGAENATLNPGVSMGVERGAKKILASYAWLRKMKA
jgi:hypothetical protein